MEVNFKNLINGIYPLTDEEAAALRAHFKPRQIAKKEFLFKEGEHSTGLYYIDSGTFRAYCLKDVEELTIAFFFSPTFYANIIAINEQAPSLFSVQALDHSVVMEADMRAVEELGATYPNILRLFIRFYENIFTFSQKRQLSFICDSAEERYLKLFRERPKVISEMPLVYISSYLGIKPESLSRIRRKISTQKIIKLLLLFCVTV
jgi:CRP-like cAMP-binding protein